MPDAAKTRQREPVKPLRLTLKMAATMLAIHYETLRSFVDQGVFTAHYPSGRGPGKRCFLTDPHEVEVFATGGIDAVREYQARKRRGNGNADSAKGKSPFRNN